MNPKFESRINIQVQIQNDKHENEELNSRFTLIDPVKNKYWRLFFEKNLPLISKKTWSGQLTPLPLFSDGPAIYGINSLSKDSNQCSLKRKRKKKWKEIGLVTFLCVSSADNSFFLFFLIWFSRLCMKVDKKRKSFLDPRLFILYHLVILEIIKDWSSNWGVTN